MTKRISDSAKKEPEEDEKTVEHEVKTEDQNEMNEDRKRRKKRWIGPRVAKATNEVDSDYCGLAEDFTFEIQVKVFDAYKKRRSFCRSYRDRSFAMTNGEKIRS